MKRIISCLLTVILVLSLCMESYAVDDGLENTQEDSQIMVDAIDVQDPPKEEIPEEGTSEEESPEKDEETDDWQDDSEGAAEENGLERLGVLGEKEDGQDTDLHDNASQAAGQIDLSLLSGQVLQGAVEFTASVTGRQTGYNASKKQVLDPPEDAKDGKPARWDATFAGLEPDTYTLSVTAPGFAHFSQEIQVEGWAYAVTLMTETTNAFEAGRQEAAHPGFLLLGDVDGDGAVSEMDEDILVDAIDAGECDPEKRQAGRWEKHEDLNRNGEVDLSDLECLAKGRQAAGDVSSTVTKKVPADAVEVRPGEHTTVDGDPSALLKNEGRVFLKPAAGGAITSSNPVSVELGFLDGDSMPVGGIVIHAGNDEIKEAVIKVEYTQGGQEDSVEIPYAQETHFLLSDGNVWAQRDAGGAVYVDFGTQVAVKKVTLTITAMLHNNHLAEISQVEFHNDLASRISEPALDIPQNLSVHTESGAFTLKWDSCVNVTGYEVKVSLEGQEETVLTKGNTLKVSSFGQKGLVNDTTYTAAVRSVNGAWSSKYSAEAAATPKADKMPDAPDGLKLSGAYRSFSASWKKMKDTDSYNLYYREKGAGAFQKVEKIRANSYTVSELKDKAAYEVYVTGVNALGEGRPSLTGIVETVSIEPAQMPKYKLINPAADGEVSAHIAKAYYKGGSMRDSKLDREGEKTAWGTVDNDPASYFFLNSWDSGGFNNLGENGLFYEFDQAYKLQDFALQEVAEQGTGYFYVKVKYWDEAGKATELTGSSITKKYDPEKRAYYHVRLPKAVTAKKLQFGLARYSASGTVTCSEVYFYHYDPLEDEIMALYTDNLHTMLRDDVTQETIDALRERINAKDEVSGEYHPEREKLERELKTAEDILNDEGLNEPVQVHAGMTTNDMNRGFGGLNAWQPLGVTAAAGEEITVYVGHNTKKAGEGTNLQLVATQYHAESGNVSGRAVNLKVGRNDITIPQMSTVNAEAGGALYVQYTGNRPDDDKYAVRVSGGVHVPCLDLYQVEDQGERQRRAQEYVEELTAYVEKMEALHAKEHEGSKLGVSRYAYDPQNCILGASDILSDQMLLSLPAAQILSGSGGSAQAILSSVDAMEDMLYLFYQHKGLSAQAGDAVDRYPSRHLNIRYQRMFAGAFMYASGNHIGIEWAQTGGMVSGAPVVTDENGRYVSGHYFGWGIAHEIGHCINQGAYAIAEITNNYYSVLAQAQDTNSSVRFRYEEVYKKVTSGTKGRASNVFTQLGMYWQLHLAYDSGYNYKTYDDYGEQLQNLFFARVDTYARTPSKAPAPGGVALSLTGDVDQNLMRLSCAAAEKDLLEFFRRWGMTPDEGTAAYAGQFEEETRAIYYVNDESRVYRLAHGGSSLDPSGGTEAVGDVSAQIRSGVPDQVDFHLNAKIPSGDVLGYEIIRCTREGGEVKEEVAGFTTTNEFSDHVASMNNRVVSYQVAVIDKHLNRSAPKAVGEFKIQDDGSIDKSGWTVSSSGLAASTDPGGAVGTPEEPCSPIPEDPIKKAADNDVQTVYIGRAQANAEVVLQFNKAYTITGLKYRAAAGVQPVKDYAIFVLDESGGWKEAASGTFGPAEEQRVLFADKEGKNLTGYRTEAVKLSIRNQAGEEIGIAELDVLGATGDDVDFRYTDNAGQAAAGTLQEDFRYGSGAQDVIPKGSLVFTGAYKGNPAYNVVILYDQDGKPVGGVGPDGSLKSDQVILADVPSQGNIEEVSDGSWIYWIEPQYQVDTQSLQSIRAELYRVDDAFNNTGQRLVSDSLSVGVNAEMLARPISLTSAQQRQ